MNKNKKMILLGVLLTLFITLTIFVLSKDYLIIDQKFYNIISENLIDEPTTNILRFITLFGGTLLLIIFALVSIIALKNKKYSIAICINLIFSASVNYIIKLIVERPRPSVLRLTEEIGYSFPSGHSMTSLAFYGFIIYLLFKYQKDKNKRNIITVLLTILIILIGFSRIYLGVHYLSDVLGGFLLGGIYLILYTEMFETVSKKQN